MATSAPYPIANDSSPPEPSWEFRRQKYFDTLKWYLLRHPVDEACVDGLDSLGQIASDEIVVVSRQRDGKRFAKSFLAHYRNLGADRFVIVDDHSTDGTQDYLRSQPDVILLPALKGYGESRRGTDWFNVIFTRLSKNQPIVYVDFDEYLAFSDGKTSLRTLFDTMRDHGRERLACLMLDLYPAPPISDAVFDGSDDRMPWDVADCFDASGYLQREGRGGMRILGGVRSRMFNEKVVLTKYPVMFNRKSAILDNTIHLPQPSTKNRGPVAGALLHFKFFSDFVEEFEKTVERGVHYQGARAYKTVLDHMARNDMPDDFTFVGEPTRRYTGPAQLSDLGLITDICESKTD